MVAKSTKIGPVGRYSTRIPKGCEFESHCPCEDFMDEPQDFP